VKAKTRGKLIVLGLVLFVILASTPISGESKVKKIIAVDGNFKPFSYVENGELKGFNIDLLKAMEKTPYFEYYDIEIEPMGFSEALEKLKKGEVNAIFGVAKTPEREEYMDFSIPYFNITFAIFSHKGTQIEGMDSLDNRTVAVRKGDVAIDYLKAHVDNPIIIEVDTVETALKMVNRGDVAAFFGDKYVALYYLKREELSNVVLVHEYGDIGAGYIGVQKGDEEFLYNINQALKQIMTDGTYTEIYTRWFTQPTQFFVVEWIGSNIHIIIPVTLGIFMLLFIYFLLLKRSIRKISQKLEKSEKLYRKLTNNALVGIMMVRNGKITFANDMAIKILGYPKEMLERKGIPNLLEKADGEIKISTPGGHKWILVKSTKLEDATLVNFLDITDKKDLEIENMRRMEYLNELLDYLRNPVQNLLFASYMLGDSEEERILKRNIEKVVELLREENLEKRGL
jgi:ABC-type amino acid transport substrate-binding protein